MSFMSGQDRVIDSKLQSPKQSDVVLDELLVAAYQVGAENDFGPSFGMTIPTSMLARADRVI